MILTFLAFVLSAGAVEVVEEDLKTLNPNTWQHVRYFSLHDIKENERKNHIAAVSFALNSVSNKRTIAHPTVVNKTLLRVDLRDYGIAVAAYNALGRDNCFKGKDVVKLRKLTNSENPIVRANWFVINSLSAPNYYQMLGVKDLDGFKKRHGYVKSNVKAEQAALVSRSKMVRNVRMIKRIPTLTGVVWEVKDSVEEDYFMNLLSEKYDCVQLLATNKNGLISYFATDNTSKGLDYLNIEIAVDHTRLNDDPRVKVASSCIVCHKSGIESFTDMVRKLKAQDIEIKTATKKAAEEISELYGRELPIKKDQEDYARALFLTTGMKPQQFMDAFVGVYKNYYKDLTLEEAARELRYEPKRLKEICNASSNPYLLMLLKNDKISRVCIQKYLEN